MEEAILRIRNLRTYFFTRRGVVRAVDGIDFDLLKSECLCLVGESGCGKTVTALSILGLIDSPPGRIVGGEIYYNNLNLLECPPDQLRRIRGKEIAMVFQDAQSALNPVFTIGYQIVEQVKLHLRMNQREAKEKTLSLLKEVGIPTPEKIVDYYPHQLSGGMRQRAMIAM
ncbi:MAG: ABC transporter ATP-binding protein, partial [Dehalococcoidia bacterium]